MTSPLPSDASTAPSTTPAPAEYTGEYTTLAQGGDPVYVPPSPTAALLALPTTSTATAELSGAMPTSPIYDYPFSTLATLDNAASMLRNHFELHTLAEQVAVRKAMLNSAVSMLHTKVMGGGSRRYPSVMAIVDAGARRMAAEGVGNARLVSAYIYPSGRGGSWCEYWPLLAVLRAILPNMDGSPDEEERLVDHIMLTIGDAAANHLHPRGAVEVGEHASVADLLWQHPGGEGGRVEWEVRESAGKRPILGACPVRFEDVPEGQGPVSIMERTWIIVGAVEGYGPDPNQQQQQQVEQQVEQQQVEQHQHVQVDETTREKVDESVGEELPSAEDSVPAELMPQEEVVDADVLVPVEPVSEQPAATSQVDAIIEEILALFSTYPIFTQRICAELWFRAVVSLYGERNKTAVLKTGTWNKLCNADETLLCDFILDLYANPGDKQVPFIHLDEDHDNPSLVLLPFKHATDLALHLSLSAGTLPSRTRINKELSVRASAVIKRQGTIVYEHLSFPAVVELVGTGEDGLVEWSIVRIKRAHESDDEDDDHVEAGAPTGATRSPSPSKKARSD